MNWRPIDSAPRDGTNILLFFPGYIQKVWIGSYETHESYRNGVKSYSSAGWSIGVSLLWAAGFKNPEPEPTHWMPLPEPPAV